MLLIHFCEIQIFLSGKRFLGCFLFVAFLFFIVSLFFYLYLLFSCQADCVFLDWRYITFLSLLSILHFRGSPQTPQSPEQCSLNYRIISVIYMYHSFSPVMKIEMKMRSVSSTEDKHPYFYQTCAAGVVWSILGVFCTHVHHASFIDK